VVHSVARSGQETIAQGLYVYSVDLCGPKGHDNLAQGLPWVKFPTELALKGPDGTARTVFRPQLWHSRPGAPSGLNTFFWLTQGKPG
jgi:hypothetical protein